MEELAYRRLLDMYYDTELPIPLETESVSRRLRLGSDVVSNVLKEYFYECEDGWRNERCDAEIAAYRRKADQARINGKLGGRRHKTEQVPTKNQSGSNSLTESKANHKPLTKNHNKPPLPPKGKFVLPDWIPSDLWADYLEARKVLKSPMTDRAKQLAVKKLDELRTAGFQPGDVLGQSIYNGWKGLFPLKGEQRSVDPWEGAIRG